MRTPPSPLFDKEGVATFPEVQEISLLPDIRDVAFFATNL
jgi:hypothetical protein